MFRLRSRSLALAAVAIVLLACLLPAGLAPGIDALTLAWAPCPAPASPDDRLIDPPANEQTAALRALLPPRAPPVA